MHPRILLGVAWAAAAGLAVVTWTPPAAAESAWDQISRTGVFRIGVMPGRPPYMWQEGGRGEWVGFAMDMGRDVAAALANENAMNKPIKVEYVDTTWATVVLDIQANKLDAFFGMSITEQRRQAIDMYGPLYALAHVYVNGKDFNPGDRWEDYNDPKVRVSVNMGTTDEQAIRRMSPKATVLAMKEESQSIMMVQSGQADVWGTSVLSGLGGMKLNPNFSRMVIPKPVVSLPSGGGSRKDGEGRLAAFLQGWAYATRASGQTKKMILQASEKAGLNPNLIPAEMEF